MGSEGGNGQRIALIEVGRSQPVCNGLTGGVGEGGSFCAWSGGATCAFESDDDVDSDALKQQASVACSNKSGY